MRVKLDLYLMQGLSPAAQPRCRFRFTVRWKISATDSSSTPATCLNRASIVLPAVNVYIPSLCDR